MEAWYEQHGAALLLFGIALCGDRGRAQDAIHQIFLKMLESAELSPIEAVRPYLFGALRNKLLSDIRQRGREVSIELDGGSWFEAPKRNYVEELSLRRALAELPDEQREVTILHVWGGLTFAEAAEVLAINANTAAARYRYALAKLRNTLSAQKEEVPYERPE